MHLRQDLRGPWPSLSIAVLLGVLISGVALVVLSFASQSGRIVASRDVFSISHQLLTLVIGPLCLTAVSCSGQGARLASRFVHLGAAVFAVGALVMIIAAAAVGRPPALNTIPLVSHPLFWGALGAVLAGVFLAVVAKLAVEVGARCVSRVAGLSVQLLPILVAMWAASVFWSGAEDGAFGMAAAYLALQAMWPAIIVPALIVAWLTRRDLATRPGGECGPHWFVLLIGLVPVAAVVPLLLGGHGGAVDAYREIDLRVSWATVAALVPVGGFLLRRWLREAVSGNPSRVASVVLALLAGLCGLLADDTGALFRAQAHWLAGSLVLAFLSLTSWRADVDGSGGPTSWSERNPSLLIAAGSLLLGAGLGRAGWVDILARLGVGGDVASVIELGSTIAVGAGVSMLIACLVSVFFSPLRVWARSAYHRAAEHEIFRSRDQRLLAAVGTALAVIFIGSTIALLSPKLSPEVGGGQLSGLPSGRHAHAVDQIRAEVEQRFAQGVEMLRAHRYDDAATAFHRVLALSPEMPEAHVNMGFAMLGKGDFQVALDFFEGATELRSDQLNAYYGMALALEGLGRFDAAAGAMRTYQHLTSPDDPFLPKVNEKLKEYEAHRGRTGPGAG